MQKIKSLLKTIKKYSINNKLILLLITVAASLVFSIPFISQPMIAEGDAYDRSLEASYLHQSGKIYESWGGMWLPLHKTVLSLSLFVFNNYFITLRVVTVLFSGLTIYFLYKITSEIIFEKNKQKEILGLLSAFIYLLLPQRLLFSSLTLTEPVFTFFLLAGTYTFLKKKKSSLFFLNIAHGIRYESWFLLPLFYWHLLIDKKTSLMKKISQILYLSAFPIYWIIENLVLNEDILFFFNEKYEVAQNIPFENYAYFNILASIKPWIENIYWLLGIVGSMSLIYGIYIFLKEKHSTKDGIFVLSTALYLIVTLVVQVYFGTMEWFPSRYLYMSIALLIPFLTYGLFNIYKKIFYKKTMLLIAFAPLLIIDLHQIFKHTNQITSPELNEVSHRKEDLFELIEFGKTIESKKVNYVYKKENNLWLYPHFLYFSEKEIELIEKESIKKQNSDIFIFEQPASSKNDQGEVIFENKTFKVLRLNEKTKL